MIKIILKILAIIGLFVLQLAIFNKLQIFGSIPNIIFLLALALLLKGRFNDALLVGAVGGLLLDLVSPLFFGLYTLLFLAILLILHFGVLKILPLPSHFLSYIIFVSSFLILDLIIFLILRSWPSWTILIDACLNGLWGIIIFLLSSRLIKPPEEIKLS